MLPNLKLNVRREPLRGFEWTSRNGCNHYRVTINELNRIVEFFSNDEECMRFHFNSFHELVGLLNRLADDVPKE